MVVGLPMGLVALELLVIVTALVSSIRILRQSGLSNLIGVGIVAVTLLVSCLLAVAASRLMYYWSGNLMLCLLLSAVANSFLFVVVRNAMIRSATKGEWEQGLRRRLCIPSWCEITLTVSIVVFMWLGFLVFTVTTVDLLSVSQRGRTAVMNTIVVRYLADESPSEASSAAVNDQRETIRRIQNGQAELFGRISDGIRRTKQEFNKATGLDSVKKELELARRFINLSEDDKVWLLTNNLQLVDLIDHPLMQPILNSKEMAGRFERLGAGNLHEVLIIGADPDMNRLLKDDDFRRLIHKIDLEELLKQFEKRPIPLATGDVPMQTAGQKF